MEKINRSVLGISPGTRTLGIAICYNNELLDWKTLNFKGEWSCEKMKKVLEVIRTIIEVNDINMISIKEPKPTINHDPVCNLVEQLEIIAYALNIPCRRYSLNDIRKYYLKGLKGDKTEIRQKLIQRYPALYLEGQKEEANQNPYYVRMFEAISVAVMCSKIEDRYFN